MSELVRRRARCLWCPIWSNRTSKWQLASDSDSTSDRGVPKLISIFMSVCFVRGLARLHRYVVCFRDDMGLRVTVSEPTYCRTTDSDPAHTARHHRTSDTPTGWVYIYAPDSVSLVECSQHSPDPTRKVITTIRTHRKCFHLSRSSFRHSSCTPSQINTYKFGEHGLGRRVGSSAPGSYHHFRDLHLHLPVQERPKAVPCQPRAI